MRNTIPRWRVWPPSRALDIERGEQFEEPLSNEPRTFTSEIDPRYPVFGNPLTSTVRRNFAAAKEEIEDLYRRIADLEAAGGPGGSGTVTSITAGTGLTGGTITGAGTIALATPVSLANGGTGVSAANAAAALTALGGAPLASPNFNGIPTAPTAAAGTATMQLATTAFVENAVGTSGGGTMMSLTAGTGLTGGTITTSGTIALDTPVSLANGGTGISAASPAAALAALGGAGLVSPNFTGAPTAPTPAAADNSMAIATTAFVKSQNYLTGNETITLSGDVTGSGATAVTATLVAVNTNVGTFQGLTVNAKGLVTAAVDQAYAPLASPPLTGTPTAPTATAGTDTAQIATTAFVKAAVDAVGGPGGSGTVTSITAGTGLTGGTITTTGTIALDPATGLSTLGGAPLNSPALTGAPTLVTPPAGTDDSNALATTAWVTSKIASATAGVSQITAATPLTASAATGNVALTLGTVPIASGGTGATTASDGLAALGGVGEPADDGFYLRYKTGSTYGWANDILQQGLKPVLRFQHQAVPAPYLDMLGIRNAKTAIAISDIASGQGLTAESLGVKTPGFDGWNLFTGTGAWLTAAEDAIGIWVDNIGKSGIAIEHGGLSADSQGLWIIRHQNTPGPSIRLTHHATSTDGTSPVNRTQIGNLLGDIVFAGVRGRAYQAPVGVRPTANGATYYANAAGIMARATENWDSDLDGAADGTLAGSNAYGTSLEFQTTANGTATPRTVFRLDHDGTPFVLHSGTLTDLFSLLGGGGSGLPAGGAVNNVLIKTGVADGAAGWSDTLNVAGVTVAGTTASYRFEDQGTAGQQWQLRAANNRAVIADPAGTNRFYIGQGAGDINIAVPYHNAQGTLILSRNPAPEHLFSAHLHLVGRNSAATRLMMDSYFSTSELWFRGSRGNATTPGLTVLGDTLGVIVFGGCSTAGTMGGAANAEIRVRATELWSATNSGTEISFLTTSIGTGLALERLKVRNGLMVEPPGLLTPLADMGEGTVNTSRGYYQNGVRIGGFAPSVAWTAGTDPDGVTIFINSIGRDLTVSRISFVTEAVNGDAATVTVVQAASGTTLSAGTPVAASFDANPVSSGMVTTVTPVGSTLPAGSRLGLQTDGNWLGNSVACITVYLDLPEAV